MEEPAPTIYPSTPAIPTVWPPTQVGDYRLGRLLGEGGMGAVFEAEDIHLGRRAAIKLMKPAAHADFAARARFLREARLMASVSHDHIVQVFAVGGQDSVPFIAMELLHGGSLDARLKERGPIPYASAVVIARQTAEALAAAHAKGLVHRDVKPSNVWLEANDDGTFRRVKLLDFGLTRPVESGAEGLTSTGAIVGTPAYMSPEQAHGKAVDPRTDLFSLGVVLYEMLTGRRPFGGDSQLAILFAITSQTQETASSVNPTVPGPVAALVDRLLSKVPGGRPASAKVVAEELRKLAKSVREVKLEVVTKPVPVDAPTPELQPLVVLPTEEPKRSRRWLLAAGAAVPVVGVGGYLAVGGRAGKRADGGTTATGLISLAVRATKKDQTDRLSLATAKLEVGKRVGTAFVITAAGHLLSSAHPDLEPPWPGMTVRTSRWTTAFTVVHLNRPLGLAILKAHDPPPVWFALGDESNGEWFRADVLAAGYSESGGPDVLSGRTTGMLNPPGGPPVWVLRHTAVTATPLDGGPLVSRDGTVLGILTTVSDEKGKPVSNVYGHALTLPQLREEIDQHCPGVTWRTPKFD